MCGISISSGATQYLRDNPQRFEEPCVIESVDVRQIKPRLKVKIGLCVCVCVCVCIFSFVVSFCFYQHSNVVECAKASLFQRKAELSKDQQTQLRFYERSSRHWSRACSAEP
jgi:hypothetical protein